jgi:hypothetical protein
MAIDERLRLNIHTKLTELLGSEEATALIEHIMPVPWHDVATKDDLRLVRADIDVVRADIVVLRADMGRNMADLRTEMHQSIVVQTRWLVGYISAFGAIMLAVARLLF